MSVIIFIKKNIILKKIIYIITLTPYSLYIINQSGLLSYLKIGNQSFFLH